MKPDRYDKLTAEAAYAIGNLLPADEWLEIKDEVPAIIKSVIDKATEKLQRDYDDLDKLYKETCQDYYKAKMDADRAAHASEHEIWKQSNIVCALSGAVAHDCDHHGITRPTWWKAVKKLQKLINQRPQPAHASEEDHPPYFPHRDMPPEQIGPSPYPPDPKPAHPPSPSYGAASASEQLKDIEASWSPLLPNEIHLRNGKEAGFTFRIIESQVFRNNQTETIKGDEIAQQINDRIHRAAHPPSSSYGAASASETTSLKLKNLKMLDAIHQVVMQHSGNKDLADRIWSSLRFDNGKGAVAPPEHYTHLAHASEPWTKRVHHPSQTFIQCGNEVICWLEHEGDADAIIAAHNITLSQLK